MTASSSDGTTAGQLRESVARRVAHETELSLDPAWFDFIPEEIPEFTHIETLLRRIQEAEPPPPYDPDNGGPPAPRDLAMICAKCLRHEPDRRYQSAAALMSDLVAWEEGRPVTARHPPPLERVWLKARRHPAIAMLSVLLFLTGAAGLWQMYRAGAEARARLVNVADQRRGGANLFRARVGGIVHDDDLAGFAALPGERGETGREVCLVFIGGKGHVFVGAKDFGVLGERNSPFEGKPWSVYIPAGERWKVTAENAVTLAVCTAPGEGDKHPARVIPPDGLHQVLHTLCEDLLAGAQQNWADACKVDPATLAQLLGEVDDPQLRLKVMRLCVDVANADQHVAEGESVVLSAVIVPVSARVTTCWASTSRQGGRGGSPSSTALIFNASIASRYTDRSLAAGVRTMGLGGGGGFPEGGEPRGLGGGRQAVE